jgi:O-antigen/teichoic acid export membrane protein
VKVSSLVRTALPGSNLIGGFLAHVRKPLYRNGYALTANSVLTSAVGFAYWVLATRHYAVDVVGTNSAAISAMGFLIGFAGLNMDGTLVRFIPRVGRRVAHLIGFAYLISLAMTALAAGLFLLGLKAWSPGLVFLARSPLAVVGFVLATMVGGVFSEQDAALIGLRKAVWVTGENTTYAFLKLGLLLIFAGLLPDYGILASWTLPTLLLIIPVNYFIFRHLVPRHKLAAQDVMEPAMSGGIARYTVGNYIAFLFALACSALPPVMVLQLAGSGASAYFYLPWLIGNLLQLVAVNMSISLVVEGSFDQSRALEYFRHGLVNTARLLAPMVALLVIGAPYLLRIFGAGYALEGALLLRLVALAALPGMVVTLYLGLLRVTNRLRGVIAVNAFIALITLGLSYSWLPHYGIASVGFALLLSESAVAAFLLCTELRPLLSHRLPKVRRARDEELAE